MTIQIKETTTNTYTKERELIETLRNEVFLLIPDPGKILKNIKTKIISDGIVCVNNKIKVNDYIEIDK